MRKVVLALSLVSIALAGPCSAVHGVRERMNVETALDTMEKLKDAEIKFEQRYGNGNYGDLSQLVKEGLLPAKLGDGDDNGYRFVLKTEKGKYSAQAIPNGYGTDQAQGWESYYLDDSRVIRHAHTPEVAGLKDSVVSESGPELEANEEKVKTTMAKIRDAEVEFEKRHGSGNYGGPGELITEGLMPAELEDGEDSGYRFSIKAANRKYSVEAVPTGAFYEHSYYLDESRIIRAARLPRSAGPADTPASGSLNSSSQR